MTVAASSGIFTRRAAIATIRAMPAVAHAAFLFVLSSQPDLRIAEDPLIDLIVRKAGHATAYAILAILLQLAIGGVGPSRRRALGIVIAVALYAVTDEVHQGFVPGRGASLSDVAIDTLGGAVGLLLTVRAQRGVQQRQRELPVNGPRA